jgi:16S rRNA (cytosine967-C5)-methyltransferase
MMMSPRAARGLRPTAALLLLLAPPASRASLLPASPAKAALNILNEQVECGAPLDVLLQRHVRSNKLTQADRKAVSGCLFAVARQQGRLDARLHAVGIEHPDPRARLLASLALSETDSSDGTAALEPTASEHKWLKAIGPPPLEADGVEMEMAARLECPKWAWPSFQAAFGDDVEAELRALQQPAPLTLRVNTLKASREEAMAALRDAGFACEPTRYSPCSVHLAESAVPLGALPGLLDGVIEPQDEGSTLVAMLLGAQPGEAIADYCAGSGGKTLCLAAAMRNKGKLLAMDISAPRLERSAPRCAKAGVDNVERHVIDASPEAKKWLKRRKRTFDRVLVDAPCSGVGAWRRNPDARWLRRTRTLEELLPIQADVLTRAARLVRPGGVLVYATCSLLPEENEKQVEAFLASEDGGDFALHGAPDGFGVPLEPSGFLKLTPARHGCDGFFGAVLMRSPDGWGGRPTTRRRRPRGGRKSS